MVIPIKKSVNDQPIKTANRSKGNTGEEIACKYLKKQGFQINDRNYRKPWGELDIIAVKDSQIHFFEVKSITVSRFQASAGLHNGLPAHSPEENVHEFKLKQIRKMIRTYFSERRVDEEKEFQFHVICVYMNMDRRIARVRMIRNVIL